MTEVDTLKAKIHEFKCLMIFLEEAAKQMDRFDNKIHGHELRDMIAGAKKLYLSEEDK